MKIQIVALAIVLSLSITCAAVPAPPKHINLPRSRDRASLPFSDAVLAGDTLYIAGHIGLDPKTGQPAADASDEARLVMDQIKQTVEAAGMTMEDVVSIQVLCSDVSLYDTFNKVYRTYFKGEFPARAFLGSGKLLFNARYEVMGVAVKAK
jgi:2-iminobutanoate/2-iminopropanoate deaminase